jgi:hypothetical protein
MAVFSSSFTCHKKNISGLIPFLGAIHFDKEYPKNKDLSESFLIIIYSRHFGQQVAIFKNYYFLKFTW